MRLADRLVDETDDREVRRLVRQIRLDLDEVALQPREDDPHVRPTVISGPRGARRYRSRGPPRDADDVDAQPTSTRSLGMCRHPRAGEPPETVALGASTARRDDRNPRCAASSLRRRRGRRRAQPRCRSRRPHSANCGRGCHNPAPQVPRRAILALSATDVFRCHTRHRGARTRAVRVSPLRICGRIRKAVRCGEKSMTLVSCRATALQAAGSRGAAAPRR
jgi:hypothetical protein